MGKCTESLKKNSLKLNAASHNNASWYTDTDGFLEHTPGWGSLHFKGPALQKIIPVFFWSLFIFSTKEKLKHFRETGSKPDEFCALKLGGFFLVFCLFNWLSVSLMLII